MKTTRLEEDTSALLARLAEVKGTTKQALIDEILRDWCRRELQRLRDLYAKN